jgi:hypothetical protein
MIKDLLVHQRKKILARWTKEVLDAYPSESGPFLKGEGDRFSNPVGYTISGGLERIYDGLLEGGTGLDVQQAIEDIIRMRAVQQFSPSEAVGFLMPLKRLIREVVESIATEPPQVSNGFFADFVDLEVILDRLTLRAVDCYAGCRESVYRTSVKEARAGGMMAASIMGRKNQ